jgi:hypothetical protein
MLHFPRGLHHKYKPNLNLRKAYPGRRSYGEYQGLAIFATRDPLGANQAQKIQHDAKTAQISDTAAPMIGR